ncbi:hypothetical protein [Pseudomonas mediterranea]|uniref:hypothetical protein n=1 Tax=Pseudomonas mediterranea TaxID=183795 RepID=UPI00191F9772|nr:hypothetical protein [Pseudomonas mediterranea]MBL0845599.1 hypothetical protein [Pseudomonas mediterranea]
MTQPTHTATAGTLDPSFADEGVLKFPIPEISGFYTQAVLALPANKILLGMALMGDPPGTPTIIMRLNEDGSLDTGFGGNGSGLIEIPIVGAELDIRKLYGLSDGGCLVMGQFSMAFRSGLFLVRYREDWQLDESFGEEGVQLIPYKSMGNATDVGIVGEIAGSSGEEPSSGAPRVSGSKGTSGLQQLDGKIFLTHVVTTKSGQRKGIVLRLNSDGSTDYTFNERGFALVELEGIDYEYNAAGAVAVQADGKVLVSGRFKLKDQNSWGVYVTRFDAMGRLDRSFNGGTVTVRHPSLIYLRDMEIREADGNIVAVGEALRDGVRNGMIFVLTEGGFFDFNFNRGQPLFSRLVPQGMEWWRCVLQADGSIIAAGTTGNGFATEDAKVLTARLLPDGSLDPTFNGNGFTVFDEDKTFESMQDMTMMADGRIVECGLTWVDVEPWAGIAGGWVIRYLA